MVFQLSPGQIIQVNDTAGYFGLFEFITETNIARSESKMDWLLQLQADGSSKIF